VSFAGSTRRIEGTAEQVLEKEMKNGGHSSFFTNGDISFDGDIPKNFKDQRPLTILGLNCLFEKNLSSAHTINFTSIEHWAAGWLLVMNQISNHLSI
jgi:hypothetical protein